MRAFRCALGVATLIVSMLGARGQDSLPLVDIKTVDPTIVVSLRYAGPKNLAGRALYPPGRPALVQPQVAQQLALWEAVHNSNYVADPNSGAGSLHSWGVAVDATLTDTWNNPVSMPSDFDDLTPAAMWRYRGNDAAVRGHLRLLQFIMAQAGFYGLRTEWWHFTIEDWQKYLPPQIAKRATQVLGTSWEGKL
jgi:D-alanyl-D-alanine dipeptidase